MYGCQTWSVTDRITVFTFLGERNTLRKELQKTSDLAVNIKRTLM
jgi:hypothetical protein